jgi:pimeloyl-ACP methyl ester carboxylesterase
MPSPSHSLLYRVTVPVLSALALAACGGDDDDPATPTVATAEQACSALSGKTLAAATVTAAATVAASGPAPVYCRVAATIAPQLNLELRLPQQWNGKLYYGGGGGYNGAIPDLSGNNLTALQQGYATVNSDSGHSGNVLSAAFALNDTYAANLFGSLSIPTVTSSAKEMLLAAYGKNPDRSYFEGCSNGGREALMAAERNPNLFDGIISRAPAYNWVGFMGQFNRTAKALAAPGGQFNGAKLAFWPSRYAMPVTRTTASPTASSPIRRPATSTLRFFVAQPARTRVTPACRTHNWPSSVRGRRQRPGPAAHTPTRAGP